MYDAALPLTNLGVQSRLFVNFILHFFFFQHYLITSKTNTPYYTGLYGTCSLDASFA